MRLYDFTTAALTTSPMPSAGLDDRATCGVSDGRFADGWVLHGNGSLALIWADRLAHGSGFDGGFDTGVGTAAANVTVHSRIDVGIAWIGVAVQQGGSAHDLSGLTVTALRYIVFQPGFLNGMITIFRKTFNGSDRLFADGGYRQLAGAHGRSVQMYGTGSALGDAATVFGAYEIEVIPQNP